MSTVSICIPTYNGAAHLRECLDAVVTQSYRELEVIIVDDQSSDETWDLLNQYAAQECRIRLFRNDYNCGLVGNWNRCIELAQGEWIKFVFQDDVLHANCVERMLLSATKPIVFCKRSFVFDKNTDMDVVKDYESIPSVDDLTGSATDIGPEQIQDLVLKERRNFFGEPTASLIHRSVFHLFGRFNQDLAQFCDLEYWIRVTVNTGMAYVPDVLASFRYHARSASAGNRDASRMERVDVFDRLIMLHEYAYNHHFAALRRRAKCAYPPRLFKWELARKAPWVKGRAFALARAPDTPDTSWILQWESVVRRYPKIGWSVWQLPYLAQSWLNRNVGWRIRAQ